MEFSWGSGQSCPAESPSAPGQFSGRARYCSQTPSPIPFIWGFRHAGCVPVRTGYVSYKVPFIRPSFPRAEDIATDMGRIVEANWYTNFGPYEREFSEAVASYVGPGFKAATFANATLGLMAALSEVIGRGDGSKFIIVPSFTFAAGPQAIDWCGYQPLFIDVEADTLQPDLVAAQTAHDEFGNQVAGILLCNTFGIGNSRVDEWDRWARETGLPLVIDSAAGFGSDYADGSKVGRAGVCEVFSFHATKPLAVGEGGAVVSSDVDLVSRLRSFQNFGFNASGGGATSLGLNAKLQEINAAIGLRQLSTLDRALTTRRTVVNRYRAELPRPFFRFPQQIEFSSVCFATVGLPDTASQQRALALLQSAGVEARSYYSPAVHRQDYFKTSARIGSLPATEHAVATGISLPVHQDMDPADVDLVISTLRALAGLS
ncbi:DegT/DnrJ/EryC1/StrS aminotransferase family protein [Cryobacterium sp. TMT1-21]|nr:DegT/DnrJ/EryC1/StrS aminotransferase family protein [Cryobacterium sp. TMT1-21]